MLKSSQSKKLHPLSALSAVINKKEKGRKEALSRTKQSTETGPAI